MNKEMLDKFFEETGLNKGIENMNKFEKEIMIPEINRRLEKQREEFERLIDKHCESECAYYIKKELKNQLRK